MNGEIDFQGLLRGSIADEKITNYEQLTNKPKINGVELVGDKSTEDLNISYNDLQDKPTQFSGNYNDLSNKPKLNGEVISGNNYSLVITSQPHIVGTWIDGKPIYCKHVAFGSQIAIEANQWYYYPNYDASHIYSLVGTICLVRPNGNMEYPTKDVKYFDVGVENNQLTFLPLRNGTDYISEVVLFYTDVEDYL